MRLASVVAARSVTWCGLPKAGSCSCRTCSATTACSGDPHRSLRIVQDDLMRYGMPPMSGPQAERGPAGRAAAQDRVRVADPVTQQWPGLPRVDDLLDSEPLGCTHRVADRVEPGPDLG